MKAIVSKISHHLQRYNTLGDYKEDMGKVHFTISDLRNSDYEFLVTMHEMIEYYLTKRKKITEQQITEFDVMFEEGKIPNPDNIFEPGDHPLSPYKDEHRIAENIERILAQAMGIDFNVYNKYLENFCNINSKHFEQNGKPTNG